MASIKNAWNPGLNKQIRKKLKKRNYTLDEVEEIYQIVANLYYQRMKTFKYLIIFLIAVVIMMLLLNYIYMEDKLLAVMSSLIVAGMILMIMIFMYFMWVLKEKKQLLKGLAEGYPELLERYEYKFREKLNK